MKYVNNGLRVCWIFFKTVLWELLTELISVIILTILFTIKMMQLYGKNMNSRDLSSYILHDLEYDPVFFGCLLILNIILILVLYVIYHRKEPDMLPFERKNCISKYIKGYICGLILFILIWLISLGLGGFQVELIFRHGNIAMLCLFFVGYLFQGMSEEVLFRGYLYKRLNTFLPLPMVIALTSLLFAVMHLGNDGISILAFINLVIFGVFTALIRYHSNSLWFIGALHSAWNFTQGPLLGVAVSGNGNQQFVLFSKLSDATTLINGGSFGLEGSLITTLILLVAIFAITKKFSCIEKLICK